MTRGDVNQVGLDLSVVDRGVDRLDEDGFVWFAVGASLPFKRYCTYGPLTGIWERYSPPDLFEGQAKQDLIANRLDEGVLWNAIAYAIWDKRVARNSSVAPNPPTENMSVDVAGSR